MAALAQGPGWQHEWKVLFTSLLPGDQFTFRPDLGIWLIAMGRPHVYDPRRGRYCLQTRDHGLAFANEDCKVLIRK